MTITDRPRILVIGSSNVDFIMQVDRLPKVGETVTDAQFTQTFGGKGANQAVAAARAGGRVSFVTGFGNDLYAPTMRENFNRDEIDCSQSITSSELPCGSALVMFDRLGNNYLTVAPGANYAITPGVIDQLSNTISQSNFLILQMEIPTDSLVRILEIAYRTKTRTVFNYAPIRDLSFPLSERLNTLIVNEHEAGGLTGIDVSNVEQSQKAAAHLRSAGPRIVIITLGSEGSYVSSPEFTGVLPAFSVAAIDTTAAGDTFCGAFTVALGEGRSIPDSVRFASAAAAIAVGKMGAQPSIPSRIEIDTFLVGQR